MVIYGVDVARYQGNVNWASVAAAGIQFATIKASEGSRSQTRSDTVEYFRREFREASRSIPLVGAYHVVRSGAVEPQVEFYLGQIRAAGGDPVNTILQVDYEHWEYDHPSYSTLRGFILALRRAVPGCQPILYTGRWVWDAVRNAPDNSAAQLGVPLWDSHYVNGTGDHRGLYERVPYSWWRRTYGGWVEPTVLQYSASATVPGISTQCDVNAYRGTTRQLANLLKIPMISERQAEKVLTILEVTDAGDPRPRFVTDGMSVRWLATQRAHDHIVHWGSRNWRNLHNDGAPVRISRVELADFGVFIGPSPFPPDAGQ